MLDEVGYEYAVVSEPDRQYLWILSRKPAMDPALYNSILAQLKKMNFDLGYLIKTPH